MHIVISKLYWILSQENTCMYSHINWADVCIESLEATVALLIELRWGLKIDAWNFEVIEPFIYTIIYFQKYKNAFL